MLYGECIICVDTSVWRGYMCMSLCVHVFEETCVWYKCMYTFAHGCGVKNVILAVILRFCLPFVETRSLTALELAK